MECRWSETPSPLWQFSLGFYAKAGVAKACLRLQDEFGADVNVLLALLWLASRRRTVTASQFAALHASSRRWHSEVVVPLRNVRRLLKKEDRIDGIAADAMLYPHLKEVELHAEYLEQEALHTLVGALEVSGIETRVRAAAESNLAVWSEVAGHPLPAPAAALIAFLEEHCAHGNK
jgi:uncharacterized protein (TIGR02444 family)